ncbi:hypothetical protein C5L14_29735 [Labrys okinawensis]|uniref:Uncharacterized protein n=1 Tax=Labrys okinawensis TaxID=346911 RepID=A0A2S9Q3H1_9HYPH|nr:hypothetical protein [Labrys okinawensis]PRH83906.1 hypothetical protein C5L14_29735 [Labrys okinawensis]
MRKGLGYCAAAFVVSVIVAPVLWQMRMPLSDTSRPPSIGLGEALSIWGWVFLFVLLAGLPALMLGRFISGGLRLRWYQSALAGGVIGFAVALCVLRFLFGTPHIGTLAIGALVSLPGFLGGLVYWLIAERD